VADQNSIGVDVSSCGVRARVSGKLHEFRRARLRRKLARAQSAPIADDKLLARTFTWMMRLLAALIIATTVQCFAQSYRQLFDWATHHRVPQWIAPTWPLAFDAFILIGEIVFFASILRRWPRRTRVLGAGMAIGGLVASVAAQWLYLPPAASNWDRGTAVVAPLGATLGLFAGLTVLKWIVNDPPSQQGNGKRIVAEAEQITRAAAPADEVAQQRSKRGGGRKPALSSDSREAQQARMFIEAERNVGRNPSAYTVGMRYLGGDPYTGRRGNERLAKQLLAEGVT